MDLAVLSELRSEGVIGLIRRLFSVRTTIACVLVEDASSGPLLPVLQFLISLTRARRLALIGPSGEISDFGRRSGWAKAFILAAGSLSGFRAAATCAVDLWRISRERIAYHSLLKPKPNVLYLKTNLWFGVRAGGSVGHVAGVANALASRCTRVDLVSVEKPALVDDRIHYQEVPHAGAFGYPYELNYYRYQRQFRGAVHRLAKQARPDLIYHRTSIANYSGLQAKRDLGIPLVVEYNGSEVWVARHWGRPLLFSRLAAAAEDESLRHADLVVTVSDVLADDLRARGVPDDRIVVHPNCVDAIRFDPERFSRFDRLAILSQYGIDPESAVCGFIGTFGAWHGVNVLAEAIREMVSSHREWLEQHRVHFLIVGDGLLMPLVREVLRPEPIARFVTLTGLVEQKLAARYLAACDVVLSPHVPNPDGSRFFGSPTKLFEYMAMAKGIVASDLDQIGQVLEKSYRATDLPTTPCPEDDHHLSILTTPGSREELMAGVRFLVQRPDYRRVLGRNARQEVLNHYTWDRNVELVLARLRSLQEHETRPTARTDAVQVTS